MKGIHPDAEVMFSEVIGSLISEMQEDEIHLLTEENVIPYWNEFKIKDVPACLDAIYKHSLYHRFMEGYGDVVRQRVMNLATDKEIALLILNLLNTYYPSIMAEVRVADKAGKPKMGNRLATVILAILDGMRNG